jgi:SecD/SecF fusion protein
VFGGGVINDFAFTFLIGILTGTYSSIYIASALVLWWHKGDRPAIGGSQVTMQNTNTASARV